MSSFADALRALMGQARPVPPPPPAPPQPSPFQQRLNQGDPRQGNIFLPLQSAETMGPLPPASPTDYTPLPTQAGALYDNRPKIGPANQFNTKPMPQTGAEPFGQRIQSVEDLVKMVGGMTPTPRNQPEVMMGGGEKPSLPGLYSRLLRGFEAVPAKQLHPNKIASMFQQVPEEAQFTGASQFAQGNTPVPTQQIVEHLRENPIQLGEKVLSDATRPPIEGPMELIRGELPGNGTVMRFPSNGDPYRSHGLDLFPLLNGQDRNVISAPGMPYDLSGQKLTGYSEAEILDKLHQGRGQLTNPPTNPPEYSQYTLPGAVKGTNQERVISWKGPFPNANEQTSQGTIYRSGDPQFQSHAFNVPNTQVWSRSNIHETPNGPFKFLEEIQSDWHQKGKDKGYQTAPRELETNLDNLAKARYGIGDAEWAIMPQTNRDVITNMVRTARDDGFEAGLKPTDKVPDSPFKSSWADLALKRELHDAASKDLSGIAWTPGRVQNQRWDLGQVTDALMFDPHPTQPGKGVLIGFGTNGNPFHYQIGGDSGHTLEDYVGKGMAEHLRTNPKTRIETKGLDVGGAGMRQFYDQEVPRKLEKLVGPLGGGKVEPVGFMGSHDEGQFPYFQSPPTIARPGDVSSLLQGLRLTPELKRAILSKGFPLLSLGAAAFSPQLSKLQDAAKPLDTTPPKR